MQINHSIFKLLKNSEKLTKKKQSKTQRYSVHNDIKHKRRKF